MGRLTGTRLDSSSLPHAKSTNWPGRYSPWLIRTQALLIPLILAGGWVGRGGPIRHDAAADGFWKVGRPAPIVVHEGRSIVRVATPEPGSEVLVVVSALARSPGPYPIRLTARPATGASIPELADDGPRRPPAKVASIKPKNTERSRSLGLPSSDRVFHMLARDGDPGIAANYTPVRGVLKGVGRRSDLSAHVRPGGSSERCRRRRAVHDLLVELARPPGRGSISGGWLHSRGRS